MSERSFQRSSVPGAPLVEFDYWSRVVPVLGVLVIVGAAVRSTFIVATHGPLLEAVLDLLLIGSLGLVLLVIRVWLPRTTIQPAFYPRIALWVMAGIAVMGAVLVLRIVHPGVNVQFAFGTQAVLLSIGSIAGFGIGVHEAQALTYARTLEERNEKLRRTEQRLEDAVTELEASNDRLEQFAHAASHDLKEPLRMVTSYLQLIDDRYSDELDADGTEFIEFAVDGADRMRAMIDGLLAYSRVESRGGEFDPVDLDAVLDDVFADLQVKIEETNAEVTRDPLPTVDGDESQLRQVFQNLLANAIEYSGDAPPRIHVSAARERDDWTISVHDDGIGMDPGDTDRVFDIFERLQSSERRVGSGIGLALCKRVVERHGGEIWIESEPDDGSTFFFTLAPPAEQA